MNLALLGRLDRVDGLTSGRYLLHFLAGLDIFRRGWVLCARVGHEVGVSAGVDKLSP